MPKNRDLDSWQGYAIQSILGETLESQDRLTEAEPLLMAGYEGLLQQRTNIPWENRILVEQAADRIFQLYQRWGRPEKAADWQKRAR